MPAYTTLPRMRYTSEEVWFAASLYVLSWEEDFHQLMLNDQIRMDAYERAIRAVVKPGMAVADLGTGTGILAQWALEAGARVVHGIEVNEKIVPRALERMAAAGFSDRFQIHRAFSYNVTLPEKVDVLISEILGNMADNEGMTAILNDARPRFLKEGGRMLPCQATSFLVPVSAVQAHSQVQNRRCRGLSEQYDLDDLLESLQVSSPFDLYFDTIIPKRAHLAPPAPILHLAFEGNDIEEYSRDLLFVVEKEGLFTGFKGTFTAELAEGIVLDISGDDIEHRQTSDSWKHCFLPVEWPAPVQPGDVIEVCYRCSRSTRKDSPLGQHVSWSGAVRRGDEVVSRFRNRRE